MSLTTKELGWIEECLRTESLALKMSQLKAQAVRDPEMKQFFQKCHQQAQQRMGQFQQWLSQPQSIVQSQPFLAQAQRAGGGLPGWAQGGSYASQGAFAHQGSLTHQGNFAHVGHRQ